MGNQIWGVPPDAVVPPRDPIATIELLFLRMAEMHAKYWRDPELLRTPWLKGVSWYQVQIERYTPENRKQLMTHEHNSRERIDPSGSSPSRSAAPRGTPHCSSTAVEPRS